MKKGLLVLAVFCGTVALSVTARAEEGKGRFTFGLGGFGYYEMSDYESLYINFPTSDVTTSGAGFHTSVEFGVADRFTLGGDFGYSRLLYANKFKTQVKENFFIIDALGRYYFTDPASRIRPYVAGGAGTLISGAGAAPLLDLGGGIHFMVGDNVSIQAQVLYKTAIIHHRGEGTFGVAYHF